MGASEQLTEAVTVSGGGVTLRKEFVEDEYTVPTIRFVVVNGDDEERTVKITEDVPEEYSVDAVGFHPEYGAEHWTCYDDERAEFERAIEAETEYQTVYGIKIDDIDEVDAFMAEPRLSVDGNPIGEGDDEEDREVSATEVDKELLDDEDETAAGGAAESAADDATAEGDEEDDERTTASLDVDIPDEVADGTGPESVEIDLESSGDDGVRAPAPGPETGSVVTRLVEELQRNDIDGEQKAVLREQLDLGVPSETKARLDQLSNRVETVAAYADALEDFLDEEGTAQEVIRDFETQVEALREDVTTIREQTGSNASEIGDLSDDLGTLETQVDDLGGTLSDVSERADDIADSLSTTDSQLETVESDLRGAEERIDDNAADIDDLDNDLTDVEGDLSDVEDRVTSTEEDVETLDEAAADLRNDLDDVEEDVEEIHEWRDELGEMFQ